MVLAVALPLGFAVVFGISGAWAAIRQSVWWRAQDWYIAGGSWMLSALYAGLLLLLIRRRGKFAHRSLAEQRVRAWGTVIVMTSLQIAILYVFNRMNPRPF